MLGLLSCWAVLYIVLEHHFSRLEDTFGAICGLYIPAALASVMGGDFDGDFVLLLAQEAGQ